MKDQKNKILIGILLFVFWSLLVFDIRVANDFPWLSQLALVDRFRLPQLWTSQGAVGLGEYSLAILWMWPLNLLYGLGAKIGLSFAFLERLFGIIPYILIGIYSTNKLFDYLQVKGWARVVGSLFYLINTYILLVIDGGQFAIALAYAWFPLAFIWIIESISSNLRDRLKAGVGVSILGFFDIRFIYVLLLLTLVKFIYSLIFLHWKKWLGEVWEWIKSGVVILIVFAGLHAYWLLPVVLVRAPQLPAGYADVSQTNFLSFATLGHALLLLQPHWYKNVFGKVISLRPQFYLIPILVFLAPILAKRVKTSRSARRINRQSGFWLVVALIGVFLVKGSLEPWEAFYPFLFSNIPGFSMFRDPTKFYFLAALSYSVLIAFTSSYLISKFNWKIKYRKWKIRLVPLALIIYFILLVAPVWTGQMTGTFSEPINKEEFISSAESVKADQDFGRVLWIPSRPPMGYASPLHPSVEANRILNLRPFASGTVGTYETLNYLRESKYIGELLDVASIAYIGYPYPDTRREELKQDNIEYYYAFLDQLTGLQHIEKVVSGPPSALLKTRESQDHMFVAGKRFFIVGSMQILEDMVQIPGFGLENNMLVFLEDNKKIADIDISLLNGFSKYILYDKSELDLAALMIDTSKIVDPSDMFTGDPAEGTEIVEIDDEGNRVVRRTGEGWWMRDGNNIIEWRNFLQQKYGIDSQDFPLVGGWAVAEGKKELDIARKLPAIKGDRLLVRLMRSSAGGAVEFYSGEVKVGEVDTKIEQPEIEKIELTGYGEIPDQVFEYDKAVFEWVDIGELPVSSDPLVFKTHGDINVINQVAFVHEHEWKENISIVQQAKESGMLIDWSEINSIQEKEIMFTRSTDPAVNYKRISPTKYELEVLDFNEPAYLVFSEFYDEGWRLRRLSDGLMIEPEPTYTFLNGFLLPSEGRYELVFEPQKYVIPGIVASVATFAGILLYFFKKRFS